MTETEFTLALIAQGVPQAIQVSHAIIQFANDEIECAKAGKKTALSTMCPTAINPANLQLILAFLLQILPLVLPLFTGA